MIDPIFRSVEQLFLDFSWRRAVYIVTIALIAACVLCVAEWYTSYLELSRLERTAEILATLKQLQTSGVQQDPTLSRAYSTLLTQLQTTMHSRRVLLHIPDAAFGTWSWIPAWKFLCGGAPLWVLSIVGGFASKRDHDTIIGIVAVAIFGIVFAVIGLVLPTIYWPWFNLVVYPAGYILGFAAIGVLVDRREERRKQHALA